MDTALPYPRAGGGPEPRTTPFAAPGLPPSREYAPLRLGLRLVTGLSGDDAGRIVIARAERAFTSIEDLSRRSGVAAAALERLAQADAFHALGLDRRQALWAIRGLGERLPPLLALAQTHEPPTILRALTAGREVVEDYRATQLSLRAHPLSFLRAELVRRGMVTCASLAGGKDGRAVEVAGIILVRQRPGSAKGVLFITLEDETGIANGILWPDQFEAQRRTVMSSAMVSIKGRVQKEGLVIHVIADRVTDLTPMLRQVGEIDLPRMVSRGDGATYPGAPDRGDAGYKAGYGESGWKPRTDYHYRDRAKADIIPIKSHDFH